MKLLTIQKLITIGSSSGVTLPARDLKSIGLKPGDNLLISYERAPVTDTDEHTEEVVELTQKLIKRHKRALKNLSQR